MANSEHVEILQQGARVWNQWREDNPDTQVDLEGITVDWDTSSVRTLSGANLSNSNLSGAKLNELSLGRVNLRGSNLTGASFAKTSLIQAKMNEANLYRAYLRGANLLEAKAMGANFEEANLEDAILEATDFTGSNLMKANLSASNLFRAKLNNTVLKGAKLTHANLRDTQLRGVKLNGADLSGVILIGTDFEGADISDCRVFGIAAWKLKIKDLEQSNLVITEKDDPEITVDNIEIAQFVYLLLNNAKLREIIDTLTTKTVLILGRFTEERKAVLDAIREELRKHNYVPILFDFDKPANRDLTETVVTLANLSRFVIADLSNPNSIPHEVMSFTKDLLSVPVKPIFCPTKEHKTPYSMFEDHLKRYQNVLPVYKYKTLDGLIRGLPEKVIAPSEKRAEKLRPKQ